MKILGVETSCDETAVAVVEDGVRILSDQIASQVEIHARYGGVVPEVASRQHLLAILPLLKQAMTEANVSWADIDGVAVTNGPGLAGSLLVGVNVAKSVSLARGLPLIAVNHLEGHIYANWLTGGEALPVFPLVCLIVSGGHSDIVLMKCHGEYVLLGRTRDDAAGEAFDKAARILGLGYPGGPAIDRAARQGVPNVPLPQAWLKGTNDFSFSGVKTALMRMFRAGDIASAANAAASFQQTVVDVLATKTIAAAREYGVRQILLAGGVASNTHLRERIVQASPLPVLIPAPRLCTDNAAMIASAGYFHLRDGKTDGLDVDVAPGLRLTA
ncbi:MAG: tRNA (adenosine(37)-N6)-threonylcarbamoyltransferase complex transferase subunit TsaD [Chloroflexi bacterium RBG_16_57_8]|nr:MAG: tRNA (adenosine(37)-N6)-threonylcarbamoyltransferase complex transferase subunit TsaD [Chloroflexi bacterium RBG_16_57_8]